MIIAVLRFVNILNINQKFNNKNRIKKIKKILINKFKKISFNWK